MRDFARSRFASKSASKFSCRDTAAALSFNAFSEARSSAEISESSCASSAAATRRRSVSASFSSLSA